MLGLWMLDTVNSPRADVVTASLAVLPSEPGAPEGHSGISVGVWAASNAVDAMTAATSACIGFMSLTFTFTSLSGGQTEYRP